MYFVIVCVFIFIMNENLFDVGFQQTQRRIFAFYFSVEDFWGVKKNYINLTRVI